jgi:HAD superfamily hydrolase (TIGR01509 family)
VTAFLAASEALPPAQRVAAFDNDGTLWCERPTYVQYDFFEDALRSAAAADPAVRERPEYAAVLDADQAAMGEIGLERIALALAELFAGLEPEEFTSRAQAFMTQGKHRSLGVPFARTVYQPMLELLAELRDGGYRLALLTNNVREWEARWRAMLPVDELFEVVVDSAFVGVRKPDPAIYRLTCERLGVAPERCVFVDDVEVNCTAAAELGMAAVRFRDNAQAIAEIRAALGGAQLSQPSRSQR